MSYEITFDDVMDTALDESEGLNNFTPSQRKLVIDMATRKVPQANYREDTFDARRFLAAHIAVMMLQPSAGEGTEASSNIGSVSVSHTMPVNNPTAKQNILSTIYGRQYVDLRNANYCPLYVS